MSPLMIVIGLTAAIVGGCILILAVLRAVKDRLREEDLVFLQILVPKKESREAKDDESDQFGKDFREVIGVMDHCYQAMHSMADSSIARFLKGQPFVSLEYAALSGEILFFA